MQKLQSNGKATTHFGARDIVSQEDAFSIAELLVVLFLITTLTAMVVPNFRGLSDPLELAQNELLGHFKLIRGKAIASTSAYTVTAVSTAELRVARSERCGSSTTEEDTSLRFVLPPSVHFPDITWSSCFSPQGFIDNDVSVLLIDGAGGSRLIELFLGGGVRIP